METIVAIGGGGFSESGHPTPIDQFVLGLSRKHKPRVCFVPTASGDAEKYVDRFFAAFSSVDCVPTHLPLFKQRPEPISDIILNQDVIYVGGGNTRNMLLLWKEWQIGDLLRCAMKRGTILCGISAGAICWFTAGLTDSKGGSLEPIAGLGFLAGSCCPHVDTEPQRLSRFRQLVSSGDLPPGYALGDDTALHFVNGELREAVTERRDRGVWRIDSPFAKGGNMKLTARLLVANIKTSPC